MREWVKWFGTHIIVPLTVGVVASIVAAHLAFQWLKQDFRSIVDKSLDIIRFDSAIAEIETVSDYSINWLEYQSASDLEAGAAWQGHQARLAQAEKNLGEVLLQYERLLKAYDKLPIEDKPAKLYDEELVASPRKRFRDDLETTRAKILVFGGSLGEAKGNIEAVRGLFAQREKDQFQFVDDQVNAVVARVENARTVLAERKDALRMALTQFAKE